MSAGIECFEMKQERGPISVKMPTWLRSHVMTAATTRRAPRPIYLVDLRDDGVQDFALERSEHNRFVFDGICNKTGAGLDHAGADLVDSRHRNHKAVLPCTLTYENRDCRV